jgi:hypothetical protein
MSPAPRKSLGIDLMAAGDGTPWEDRGAIGSIAAYVKTTILSITSPVRLTEIMRRPELKGDVTRYALASGLMWAIGVVTFAIVQYIQIGHLPDDPTRFFNSQQFWMNTAIEAVVALAGTWAALRFGAIVFHKIVTPDLAQTIPNVLVYNVMGYALGPSIFAVIPFVGPPIAVVWIVISWMVLGIRRLRSRKAGSITACFITFLALGIGFLAVYLIGYLLCNYVLQWNSIVIIPPTPIVR